jgi:hypothetical protein
MTPRFADLTWHPDDRGRADCCEQASADLPNGWRVTFLRGEGRNASIHMDPSSRPYEICPWSPDGTPCPDEIEGDWPMQGDADEMQRLINLVAAQPPALPKGDVPLPAPPGSGEVLALDPFPKLARSIEETPPVRDSGTGAARPRMPSLGVPPEGLLRMQWYKNGRRIAKWRRDEGLEVPQISDADHVILNHEHLLGGGPVYFPLRGATQGQDEALSPLLIRPALPDDMPDAAP